MPYSTCEGPIQMIKFIRLSMLAEVLMFGWILSTQSALAIDNLACSPPTMHYPFPKTPTANNWVKVSGPSTEVCVEIPSGKVVSSTVCLIDVLTVVPGEVRPEYYQCEMNMACFGKGTFVSTQRRASTKSGMDVVCATFQNQADSSSAGLRLKLQATPVAAQPKLMRAPR
jgi:hypothetical protein